MNQSISTPIQFKRRHAAAPAHKIGKGEQGNRREETHRDGETRGTHTSLPCCVSKVSGRARKTAIYAPRSTSSRPRKAPFRCVSAYEAALEPAYFNNLTSRLIIPLTAGKGR